MKILFHPLEPLEKKPSVVAYAYDRHREMEIDGDRQVPGLAGHQSSLFVRYKFIDTKLETLSYRERGREREIGQHLRKMPKVF